MSKSRRLRRLVPDEVLYDRRVAGESLRAIAPDYGVAHTTLGDFFRRPEAVLGLKDARRRLEAERKARQAMLRSLEQDVRRRAREDKERDRQLEAWNVPSLQPYLDWLNRRDAPRGLPSRQRYSANDCTAAGIVDSGGGVEQVIDATRLRGRENVLRGIDTQIMRRALANDTTYPSNARANDRGLRRLVPDSELIRRGAAREPLRSIAADYGVSHTTVLRYFKRPEVSKQLLRTQRRSDRPRGRL
jgi:transposase